jgi:hypothetical protein
MPGIDYSSVLTRDQAGRLCVIMRQRDVNPIGSMMSAAIGRGSKASQVARMELVFDDRVRRHTIVSVAT